MRISLDWRLVRASLDQHLYMLDVSKLWDSRSRMASRRSRLVIAWVAAVVKLLLAWSFYQKHFDVSKL